MAGSSQLESGSAPPLFQFCFISSTVRLPPLLNFFLPSTPSVSFFRRWIYSMILFHHIGDVTCFVLSPSVPHLKHKSFCFPSICYYLFLYPFLVSVPVSITVSITIPTYPSPIILEAGHEIRRTFGLMWYRNFHILALLFNTSDNY